MPHLAQETIPIPTKDILSWTFDEPKYDQDRSIYIDAADPSHSITANQARVLIRKLVAGFRQTGLQRGDCVCIHSFNNIYYPVLVLGIIAAGCTFTGTNPSYTTFELNHHLKVSKAKLIISEPEILSTIRAAASELKVPKSRILILNSPSQLQKTGFASWTTLLDHGEQDWVRFDDLKISQNTTAMLCFSSGTTGLPKPAMLSHYNLNAQHTLMYEHHARPYEISRMIALPMFHAATAPSTHTSALRSGHKNIIMPRFAPLPFLTHISHHSITDLTLVPPQVLSLLSLPLPPSIKKQKLASVKSVIAGAAPLDKETQAKFQALLPTSTPFTQIWAMTETSCFASVFPYPENDDTGSVGRFLPNLDVKLVSEDGEEMGDYSQPGELCIRGPTVVRGYFGNEDANRESFDGEGYFRAGDILFCDGGTGKWYIVDRKKELIKVRAFQVSPAELEGVLLSHPQILDAAVIGIPSPNKETEWPRAYIVLKAGSAEEVKEEDIMTWMEGRLAGYKRLEGGVRFVKSIPKTPSGRF